MSKNSEAEINKSSGERGLDFMVYYEPKDPAWQEAWHMTEGTIALMRDEVQSKGVLFAVVTLSSGLQVSRNALNHVKRSDNYGSFDLFYPDRRIKALGDREKFPVLNLAPILAAYAAEHKVALHGFGQNLGMGHWNELGHRQAGEAISAWLCEQLASNNEPH